MHQLSFCTSLYILVLLYIRYNQNAAFVALAYSKLRSGARTNLNKQPGPDLDCWVRSQLEFVLGDNGIKTSFLVGFGSKFPLRCVC